MKRATRCPNCGEPVSAFAAGCAICGADLVEHRRQLEERRVSVPKPRAGGLGVRFDPHLMLVSVTLTALVISPLLGLLLAGVGAQDRNRSGEIGQRNLFLALAGAGVLLFLVPGFRFGLLSLLLS